MPSYRIKPARTIRGEILLPGDKSIAHRSIIISAIAKGKTYIYNFPNSQDCFITLKAFKRLGVKISKITGFQTGFCVEGRGLYSLTKPSVSIFAGDSGTTFRLVLGILAGQPFPATLTADKSLSHRPMRRITDPLRRMGVTIKAKKTQRLNRALKYTAEEYAPITIKGGSLRRIRYKMPVASAQVKSALLLAALYAKGTTEIFEPIKTRDHTERMLRDFGADIKIKNKIISLSRGTDQKELVSPGRIDIPADISSASFFIVAAILLPNSYLVLKSVGINPSRTGIIRVLKRMGANIKIIPVKTSTSGGEPVGDIVIKSSSLRATKVRADEIPQLIDEVPILMLVSCFAQGRTVIYGVEELRVKETDRIISMQTNLRKMGVQIDVEKYHATFRRLREKIIIRGKAQPIGGVRVSSFGDHRTAMAMVIAGLISKAEIHIDNLGCIAKSFPDFLAVLRSVIE